MSPRKNPWLTLQTSVLVTTSTPFDVNLGSKVPQKPLVRHLSMTGWKLPANVLCIRFSTNTPNDPATFYADSNKPFTFRAFRPYHRRLLVGVAVSDLFCVLLGCLESVSVNVSAITTDPRKQKHSQNVAKVRQKVIVTSDLIVVSHVVSKGLVNPDSTPLCKV